MNNIFLMILMAVAAGALANNLEHPNWSAFCWWVSGFDSAVATALILVHKRKK